MFSGPAFLWRALSEAFAVLWSHLRKTRRREELQSCSGKQPGHGMSVLRWGVCLEGIDSHASVSHTVVLFHHFGHTLYAGRTGERYLAYPCPRPSCLCENTLCASTPSVSNAQQHTAVHCGPADRGLLRSEALRLCTRCCCAGLASGAALRGSRAPAGGSGPGEGHSLQLARGVGCA